MGKWSSTFFLMNNTVDGCENLHQLRTVVNIPLFIGFQPAVWWCRSSSIHSMLAMGKYHDVFYGENDSC